MNHPQEKKSSDLFLRNDAGSDKTQAGDAAGEAEVQGKTLSFARIETLERFIFARNCPPFSLIALEIKDQDGESEALAARLEEFGAGEDILVIRERKNRFLILLKEKDRVAADGFIRSFMQKHDQLSFFAGIFSHPLEGFSSGSSLWNAQKALKHSKLTGENTVIPFDTVSLNISGDDAWQEGNLAEAIREYESALKLDPKNTNVLNSLGVCFAAKNELDRALELFRKSAETDPGEAMPIYNEGLVHEIRGEKEKALEAFEKAMALNPESFEFFFHAGKIHMDAGDLEKALPLLEKASVLKPENGSVLAFLAECFLLVENFEKSFQFFRKAQQRLPRNPQVLSGLGFSFFKKSEDLDIAATFCEEALALEPENALFGLRLARIWKKQGKEESTFPLLLRAKNAGLELSEDEKIFLHSIEASSA